MSLVARFDKDLAEILRVKEKSSNTRENECSVWKISDIFRLGNIVLPCVLGRQRLPC